MAPRFGLLLAGAFATPVYALITVGPDADTLCDFHAIEPAVAHAAQSPGFDLIAITSGTWNVQSPIVVSDAGDLTLEGGFANCGAGVATGRSEVNGVEMRPSGTMIQHTGANHLTLLNLDIAQSGASGGNGGGLASSGAGKLTLSNVELRANHAAYGGGLFAIGGSSDDPRKVVELLGVAFIGNMAQGDGGGLYVRNADVVVRSNRVDNYFLQNGAVGSLPHSGDGGAVFLADGDFDVSAHGMAGGAIGFMTGNSAAHAGGALYVTVTGSRNVVLDVANDDARHPLRFTDNVAAEGALVYLAGASNRLLEFDLYNAVVANNRAADGVILLDAAGDSAVVMKMRQTPWALSAAPPCAPDIECNNFDGNVATNGDLVDLISNGGLPLIEFGRARVRRNAAHEGLAYGTAAGILIDGSLVAGNDFGARMISNDSYFTTVKDSTFAYNTFPADTPIVQVAVGPANLTFEHDLLFEADHPVCAATAGANLVARDIGLGPAMSAGCLPIGDNIQLILSPFVDPSRGDYHLRAGSAAVDTWQANTDPSDPPPTIDLDGKPRPQAVESAARPYDFGAYEAQGDEVFRNGFDQ